MAFSLGHPQLPIEAVLHFFCTFLVASLAVTVQKGVLLQVQSMFTLINDRPSILGCRAHLVQESSRTRVGNVLLLLLLLIVASDSIRSSSVLVHCHLAANIQLSRSALFV